MTLQPEDLKAAVLAELGPIDEWATPGGYPDSLALCVIDSIQSIGQRYGGVAKVVQRYRDFRTSQGDDAGTDGAVELAATFEELGGVDGWASESAPTTGSTPEATLRSRRPSSWRQRIC